MWAAGRQSRGRLAQAAEVTAAAHASSVVPARRQRLIAATCAWTQRPAAGPSRSAGVHAAPAARGPVDRAAARATRAAARVIAGARSTAGHRTVSTKIRRKGLRLRGCRRKPRVVATQRMTIIDEGREVPLDVTVDGGAIRIRPAALAAALGWRLEAQGLCRGDICVPVRDRGALETADGVDLGALARVFDRPLALDIDEGVAVLGASAAARGVRLASLEAPDFTLPDLAGRTHTLRDQRGKKTLLIAWASW
jgi:hypothetical protein